MRHLACSTLALAVLLLATAPAAAGENPAWVLVGGGYAFHDMDDFNGSLADINAGLPGDPLDDYDGTAVWNVGLGFDLRDAASLALVYERGGWQTDYAADFESLSIDETLQVLRVSGQIHLLRERQLRLGLGAGAGYIFSRIEFEHRDLSGSYSPEYSGHHLMFEVSGHAEWALTPRVTMGFQAGLRGGHVSKMEDEEGDFRRYHGDVVLDQDFGGFFLRAGLKIYAGGRR